MLKFSKLWSDHPTRKGNSAPCRKGGVSAFPNQCSIRLGVCLRASGIKASDLKWPEDKKKPVLCWFHDSNALHVIRAEELATSLRGAEFDGLGKRKSVSNPKKFDSELAGKTGIVFFKDYWLRDNDPAEAPTGDHIDLWNGRDTTASDAGGAGSRPDYFAGYRKAKQIWFWPIA